MDRARANTFYYRKITKEKKSYNIRLILIVISFVNIFLYYSAYVYYDTILDALAKYNISAGFLTFLKYFIVFVLGFLIGFLITLGMRLKVKMNYYDIKVLALVGIIPALAIIISYSGIANIIIRGVFNSNTTVNDLYFYFFSRTDIWAIWLGVAVGSSIRLKLIQKKRYKHQVLD